jgi:hypothetical protein
LVEPGAAMHGIPEQQSASVVQSPFAGTHELSPQMKGGPPGASFGKQGKPQQSALEAQGSPALEPASEQSPAPVQRGIPRRSCWHTVGSMFTLPAQQLFSALHELVASLHTAPAGRQELPLSHRPVGSPEALLHMPEPLPPGTPGAPQQSESATHTSPVGRQPLGGWQTRTPVGPYGAQARLQHSPPHAGTPASVIAAPPLQTSPAMRQPVVPGAEAGLQRPSDAPDAFPQMPVQHSVSTPQTSPVCEQNEGLAEQFPFEHRCEQQSVFALQVFPAVLHDVLSGVHTPAPASLALHVPLQHSAPLVQAWLSLMHKLEPQLPPSQTSVQHSVEVAQDSPATLHSPGGFAQA